MVYVQRKKPQRKKKEPKAPRVIYVSDSDEDDYQQTPEEGPPLCSIFFNFLKKI